MTYCRNMAEKNVSAGEKLNESQSGGFVLQFILPLGQNSSTVEHVFLYSLNNSFQKKDSTSVRQHIMERCFTASV